MYRQRVCSKNSTWMKKRDKWLKCSWNFLMNCSSWTYQCVIWREENWMQWIYSLMFQFQQEYIFQLTSIIKIFFPCVQFQYRNVKLVRLIPEKCKLIDSRKVNIVSTVAVNFKATIWLDFWNNRWLYVSCNIQILTWRYYCSLHLYYWIY